MSTTWPDSTRHPPSSALIFASARLVRSVRTRYTRRRHQRLHVAAAASSMARAADGRTSGSRSPVHGPRTSGPQDSRLAAPGSRLPAPGPSVSRETFGGPRATPPPRAFRAHAPPPFGRLTRALHIRTVARSIGISVQIVAHSFTCIKCARRAHRSMFDKVRRAICPLVAHLRRPSLNFGKMCIIVTSYF